MGLVGFDYPRWPLPFLMRLKSKVDSLTSLPEPGDLRGLTDETKSGVGLTEAKPGGIAATRVLK